MVLVWVPIIELRQERSNAEVCIMAFLIHIKFQVKNESLKREDNENEMRCDANIREEFLNME